MARIVFCWDDGHKNDVRVAEAFEARNLRTTFAIHPRSTKANRRPPTAEQAAAYARHDLANHTSNHYDLSGLTREPDPVARLLDEVVRAQVELEHEYGKPVENLVLPFGRYNQETLDMLSGLDRLKSIRTIDCVRACVPGRRRPLIVHANCKLDSPDYWELVAEQPEVVVCEHSWSLKPVKSVGEVLDRHLERGDEVITLTDLVKLHTWGAV